ncbi:hypothetical protein EVJ58_g7329 [Rhodofomes roseus]|uniref:Uncharacterized protein n=1 Tax=Rhodofomes roseus TaxID=34475 RepID=A0A4Y9Y572_9APHY|nr:hypothetical protein EVJ58_g7329 [Rhodofomes roseus]
MDEAFLGDTTALRRITTYLHTLAGVIRELTSILADVRKGCDPDVFYNEIRPWFRGADSSDGKRKWVFQGIELDPTLREPTELSGPSAGQSSLIHALDVFLGVDQYSHSNFMSNKPVPMARAQTAPAVLPAPGTSGPATATFSSAPGSSSVPFLTRMQSYMPRHHRAFLRHLSSNPRPIRTLVETSGEKNLLEAYNVAVSALKVFRDEHVKIVALYILVPSKKAREAAGKSKEDSAAKGTGGTDAFQFVKGVRDQTAGALLKSGE